jgi:lactate dehydrogenase-like 2-hydroxyacid dehydrogenase
MAEAVTILIAVLPGNPSTTGLIDGPVLAALGDDGILINVGRGNVVDIDALIEALTSGKILSAGLDVYPREPHVPEALVSFDNVVLLPHVGSGSRFTQDAMAGLVVDNLRSWFELGRPVTPVPETPWHPGA